MIDRECVILFVVESFFAGVVNVGNHGFAPSPTMLPHLWPRVLPSHLDTPTILAAVSRIGECTNSSVSLVSELSFRVLEAFQCLKTVFAHLSPSSHPEVFYPCKSAQVLCHVR